MPMKSAFPPFQSANPGLPPSEHIFDLLFPVSANKGGSGVALIAQTPRDLRRTGANAGNTGKSLVDGWTTLGIRYSSQAYGPNRRLDRTILPSPLNHLILVIRSSSDARLLRPNAVI